MIIGRRCAAPNGQQRPWAETSNRSGENVCQSRCPKQDEEGVPCPRSGPLRAEACAGRPDRRPRRTRGSIGRRAEHSLARGGNGRARRLQDARGTPFLAADLLKNSLLNELQSVGVNAESADQKYWQHFDLESGFWRAEIGRDTRSTPGSRYFDSTSSRC